jgi:hypothetical protein
MAWPLYVLDIVINNDIIDILEESKQGKMKGINTPEQALEKELDIAPFFRVWKRLLEPFPQVFADYY